MRVVVAQPPQPGALAVASTRQPTGALSRSVRLLRRHQTVLPAAVVLFVIVSVTVFAGVLSPVDPRVGVLDARLLPPLAQPNHVLGTDPIGRDVLARLLYGARVSLVVGFVSVTVALLVGGVVGLVAGYRGGWIDTALMRLADVQLSFPSFLLAISLMAVLGAGLGNVVIALAVNGWVRYARVMRSGVLPLREVDYVSAARVVGCDTPRLLLRHIMPNTLTPALVLATLSLGHNIISESSLSFLGLGVDPQTPSWGSMLAEGRAYLATAWWVAALPGLAISVTVLAVNLLGDWMRDELDPHLKQSRRS